MIKKQDLKAAQNLLDLNEVTLVVDARGGYWVKFDAIEVDVSNARPYGIKYSLTLHSKNGDRLVGFDNAHSVPQTGGSGSKLTMPYDHRHTRNTVRPYKFKDAYTLVADFWKEVERVLGEEGVKL